MWFALFISLILFALGIGLYLRHPKFGRLPGGADLERIKNSPQYRDDQFQNRIPTPQFTGEKSSSSVLWEFLFTKKERLRPVDAIPTVKTDLKTLDRGKDILIWLGHSSYFIQMGGKRFLLDPVLSSYAAPVSFANKVFEGTNPYAADDLPEMDYLLISHDHWDHLDYPTVTALKPKVKNVICPLGVGSYFDQWGFEKRRIHEADWFTALELDNGVTIHVLPARHFSGRLLSRNKTLWAGFALVTPQRRIFFSGDSGYGPHFKEIGEKMNGFDIVLLDNGQYDKSWANIHMMPEEAAKAAEELKTKALFAGHSGKFAISNHPWDDPLKRIALASQNKNYRLLTPMIGEPVDLEKEQQVFSRWWERVN
ncbi:MBL fold metallo-hydrolase [Heliobacterium gestii]|uniref:MBL fold metallo-hydrolase n=1 Tax=Heliomicrobium gestii TaxID=2699 RepID=A0A845LG27_HELGE|nr:MBL fold metallo-hydrolase [Heliomicrobium gestii]MBM7867532.1 L-ascorbate metabolism protein UlaG (beta-lactamase superfamily) [Heliomicrobium gestii]MZP43920.1 MBL fold metallo-hydrolase [Heliomicrobium gestii]